MPDIARTYVAAEQVEKFLAYGAGIGVPVSTLLEQYDWDLQRDTDKTGYVPGHIWEAILEVGLEWAERLGEPLPGLRIAEGMGTNLGLWTFIAEKSGTVGKALEAVTHFQHLHSNTETIAITRSPGFLEIRVTPLFKSEKVCNLAADWFLSATVKFIQNCTGRAREIIESANLNHPEPESEALLARYLAAFNCSLNFSAEGNFIRIYSDALSSRLVTSDPEIIRLLEQQANEKLQAYEKQENDFETVLSKELRKIITQGQPSLNALALALGISERTLQRKLHHSSLSYQNLVHKVRLDEARLLLQRQDITLGKIASQLGFSDQHSFSRWFSSQTGEAPSKFRRNP